MKTSLTHPSFSLGAATEAQLHAPKQLVVLLVDDQPMVGEAVKRMLESEKDISFHFCSDPTNALQVASEVNPTVILQDLVLPNVDGLTMVKFFRANSLTKDVPMIVLSSREEPDIKSKAFSLGANDYIVKLPDKLELLARIRYHSQAYLNLLDRNKAFDALLASQSALKTELDEAERYVKSLLPKKWNDSILSTDWIFTSSTDLGGDSFGYHWLDHDNFAIYLLDVCGHGVGAALLSVSAMNVLRSQSLPDVDFKKPDSVMSGMNLAFDMDKQNNMYFTLWYAVFNKPSNSLSYSSAGHPPAILISNSQIHKLETPGMVVGATPDASFSSKSIQVSPGDKLYIFSDGVYEITKKDDPSSMLSLDEFAQALTTPPLPNLSKVQSMVAFSQSIQDRKNFDDDFSLVEITFK